LRRRDLVFPLLLIASALVFAACGSSDSNSSGSDEGQITKAIRTVVIGTDPSNCKKLETLAFAEQSGQTEGKEAVKQCEEEAGEVENNPKSVTVTKIEVNGSAATADASFVGGGFDGQTASIALVKDGDQWKLDEVAGFAKFDQAKLVKQFEDEFENPANKIRKSTATCLVKELEKASKSKFEELLLSGSAKPVEELIEGCS
jgi:hypothetical protein